MTAHFVKQIGPFGLVVLVHIAFFYALQSGLLREATQLLPKEVFATFIAPEPEKIEPVKPQPKLPPKVVEVVKKSMPPPLPQPTTPVVVSEPSPTAISTPVVPPQTTAPVTEAVATATPAAQPKTISSGVEYIQPPQPEYPAQSKRKGEEGKVILRVLIDDTGHPQNTDVHSSSGSARLDMAACKAAMRALFKPHLENGTPVPVYVLIPINFQLNG